MIKAFGASDIGLHRKQNQDSYLIVENEAKDLLAVVCDGIGGGLAGDVSSPMGGGPIKGRLFFQKKIFQDFYV